MTGAVGAGRAVLGNGSARRIIRQSGLFPAWLLPMADRAALSFWRSALEVSFGFHFFHSVSKKYPYLSLTFMGLGTTLLP